jgi:hypothetical protein
LRRVFVDEPFRDIASVEADGFHAGFSLLSFNW